MLTRIARSIGEMLCDGVWREDIAIIAVIWLLLKLIFRLADNMLDFTSVWLAAWYI